LGYPVAEQHTLIIGNAKSDESEYPSPDAGVRNSFDNIFDLGRKSDIGVFGAGQNGREAAGGSVDGLHFVEGGDMRRQGIEPVQSLG
jgi:hypothetical protein